jgi:hypothetical protein
VTTKLFSIGAAATAPAVFFATPTATTIAVTATASGLGISGVALGVTSVALLSGQRAKSATEERANVLYLEYVEAKAYLDTVLSSLLIDLAVVELDELSRSQSHKPEIATVFSPSSAEKITSLPLLKMDAAIVAPCPGGHS